ncbi:MAG: hypothetical protein HW416_2790 [Chloroflexi bacterium]|nr:hypothetical protein [Chloroflexota bacterium]
MSEQDNTAVVQGVYAAFARGDVAFILNSLADKVDWHHHGPPLIIPWAKSRHSRAEVAEFFTELGQTMEFEQFEPRKYVAQGDTVVALGYWKARAKATGRRVEEYWAMEWTLADGKVVGYRAYDDTAAIAAALRPS